MRAILFSLILGTQAQAQLDEVASLFDATLNQKVRRTFYGYSLNRKAELR
jgi:hypothetical protein